MIELMHILSDAPSPVLCVRCFNEIFETPHCFDNIEVDIVNNNTFCHLCYNLQIELRRTHVNYINSSDELTSDDSSNWSSSEEDE